MWCAYINSKPLHLVTTLSLYGFLTTTETLLGHVECALVLIDATPHKITSLYSHINTHINNAHTLQVLCVRIHVCACATARAHAHTHYPSQGYTLH